MKRRNRRVKKRILNYLIFMGIFSYIIYNLVVGIINSGIQTYTVRKGELFETMPQRGVIVRKEKVFYSNAQGVPEYLFKEGERVGSFKKVCDIRIKHSDRQLEEESDTIKRRLEILQSGKLYSNQFATDEKLERAVTVKRNEIKNSFMSGSTVSVSRLKKEMLYILDQKSILYGDFSRVSSGGKIEGRIASIQKEMESSAKSIKNTFPGVLSLYVDGYEDVLGVEKIQEIDSQVLKGVENKNLIKKGIKMEVGQPVFKIVNNHYWHVVFTVGSNDLNYFEKGKWMTIRIDGEDIGGIIKDIRKDKYGKHVIVFKTNSNGINICGERVHEMEIVLKNISGIKIPVKSIKTKGDKRGVYVVSETGITLFKELDCILGENSEYVILDYKKITREKVDTVNLYDEIVLNPEKAREGKKIR